MPESDAPSPPAAPAPPRAEAAPEPDVQALKQALQRAQRVLVGSSCGYWERDLRTGSIWFSPAFFQTLNLPTATSREEVNARLHPDDRAVYETACETAVRHVGSFSYDVRYLDRQNRYRWVRAVGRVWPDARGHAAKLVGMMTDVHAEKEALEQQRLAQVALEEHQQRLQQVVDERTARLEAALIEAHQQRAQAEQANEVKSAFLAHMSHEIRTPLNGLLGLNELALRDAESDQQRRHLKLALQSGRSLLAIINDVLDFSQLSAGALRPKPHPFDLADALTESMRGIMPMVRVKGLGMMFDYLGTITRVVGDVQRVQQIATNLLGNAAKFTDSGHIQLVCAVRPVQAGRCMATITVRDTGAGMSEDVASRVFEAFVQGDGSLSRQHGGTGLGLSIAHGLARAMGGDIWLTTSPGAGSTFICELPFEIQPGLQPASRTVTSGRAWLVYQRTVPAQWLSARFERLGWGCDIVLGLGRLADRLMQAHRAPPDLVVLAEHSLDSQSDLHGIRALLPDTNIVLLVRPDWNQPSLEAQARAAQMPLLFMPVTPQTLIDVLSERGTQPARPESGFMDLQSLPGSHDVLLVEDNEVNQIIIAEMIESLGVKVRLAANGAEAIEACQASAPSLVLMDLQMPVMDGLEATRQLRMLQAQNRLPEFPILALTAHATPQDRDKSLAAGTVGYLTKPLGLASLRSELGRWIQV